MSPWITGALTVSLAMSAPLAGSSAQEPLDAVLHRADGRKVPLSEWRGKPVILFYEDRDSTQLNARFKEELFARAQAQGLLDAAWVVAVADLQAFNFFPARPIALSFVKEEEKRQGIPILVDLEGTLGAEPWALPRKTSNVLLLDAEGRPVYRSSGRMTQEQVDTFFRLLGGLVGRDLAPQGPALRGQ